MHSYVKHSHGQPTGHTVYSLKDHTRSCIQKKKKKTGDRVIIGDVWERYKKGFKERIKRQELSKRTLKLIEQQKKIIIIITLLF